MKTYRFKEVDAFTPAFGVLEDPVTGSANATLTTYMVHHGLLDRMGRE
jgi:predicted PhzF superfamily epimerase YddE/YHI9